MLAPERGCRLETALARGNLPLKQGCLLQAALSQQGASDTAGLCASHVAASEVSLIPMSSSEKAGCTAVSPSGCGCQVAASCARAMGASSAAGMEGLMLL